MSFQISDAVIDGIDRVLSRTGGILFGVLLVVQLLNTTLTNTVTQSLLPARAAPQVGLTLPIPGAVAGALSVLVYVFIAVFFIVMARAFARPMAEMGAFPSELYTRRIGWATLSALVASILVFISVSIGFVLLIVPGVFLALSFLFFQFAIGVEDQGVVGSLRRSWELSSGNRLKLLFLLAIVVGISVVSTVVTTVSGLAGIPAVGDLVVVVVSTLMGLFYNGVLAAAYRQLAGTTTQF